VDNGPQDDSIPKIEEYCQGELVVESDFFEYQYENKPLTLFKYQLKGETPRVTGGEKLFQVENDHNSGYAEGNNYRYTFSLGKI